MDGAGVPPPPRRPTGPAPGSKEALLQALQGAVKSESDKRQGSAAPRRATARSSRRVMWLSLGLLAAVLAWLAITRPPWVFQTAAPAHSAEFQDASLRMLLYMESRRIENYRQANGTLPTSLKEVGVVPEGVRYTTYEDGTYLLEGRSGTLQLTFRSTDSAAPFLKNSFELLSRREVRP